jgi:biotin synthesis protein BioG
MKTAWLKQEGAEELLLLFNGWGMDSLLGNHLLVKSLEEEFTPDLLICYDYNTHELEPVVMKEISRYRRITIMAWSFGVWAAQQTNLPPITRAIAINGTLHPVNAEKGIRPDVFEATLSTWSEENRQRFNRRMCGSNEALSLFSTFSPDRSAADQQEELARLKEHLLVPKATSAPWSYDHAVIGGRDLVFPPQQQYAAWKELPRTVIADMPHFPFYHFRNLQEVLACFRT